MTIRFLVSYCLILNVVNIQASFNPHLITAAITVGALLAHEPQDQTIETPSMPVKNNHQKIHQQKKERPAVLPLGARPTTKLRKKGYLNQPQQRSRK